MRHVRSYGKREIRHGGRRTVQRTSYYDLKEGCFITVTEGIPIKREAEPAKKAAGVFGRLVAAGERLRRVILNNEGGANKDLARFADQINSLCDKWDR